MAKQTEVQRIGQDLVRAEVTGDALMRKFRSAARGDIKLACALKGYFSEGDEAYLPYLRTRLRPAVTELVLAGRIRELAGLEALELLSQALTEEALETAIAAHVPDSIIWLLKYKERRFGFSDREPVL